jgi:hypothetical protein
MIVSGEIATGRVKIGIGTGTGTEIEIGVETGTDHEIEINGVTTTAVRWVVIPVTGQVVEEHAVMAYATRITGAAPEVD